MRIIARDDTVLKTKQSDVKKEYIEYNGRLLVTEVWISVVTTKHVRIRVPSEHEIEVREFKGV